MKRNGARGGQARVVKFDYILELVLIRSRLVMADCLPMVFFVGISHGIKFSLGPHDYV